MSWAEEFVVRFWERTLANAWIVANRVRRYPKSRLTVVRCRPDNRTICFLNTWRSLDKERWRLQIHRSEGPNSSLRYRAPERFRPSLRRCARAGFGPDLVGDQPKQFADRP